MILRNGADIERRFTPTLAITYFRLNSSGHLGAIVTLQLSPFLYRSNFIFYILFKSYLFNFFLTLIITSECLAPK